MVSLEKSAKLQGGNVTEQNKFSMKLTLRQKEFLAKLTSIYQEIQKPVHYGTIAKRLGLCGSTVYDMLRVLEQKGMVSSEYCIPKAASGPGRSSIMFLPAAKAMEQFASGTADTQERGEWEEIKTDIMLSLSCTKDADYKQLFHKLFERANKVRSPLAGCAQIITALLLSFKQAKHESVDRNSVGTLLRAPATKLSMSTVAGLILGLSLTDKKVRKLLGNYQEHINKYIASLQNMSYENLLALHKFTLDVWNTLQINSTC